MNLKFKSGLLIFGFLWTILKNRRRLCGNVGSVKRNPSHCGKCGKVVRLSHAFHNDGISTKLLLWDIV